MVHVVDALAFLRPSMPMDLQLQHPQLTADCYKSSWHDVLALISASLANQCEGTGMLDKLQIRRKIIATPLNSNHSTQTFDTSHTFSHSLSALGLAIRTDMATSTYTSGKGKSTPQGVQVQRLHKWTDFIGQTRRESRDHDKYDHLSSSEFTRCKSWIIQADLTQSTVTTELVTDSNRPDRQRQVYF